MERFRTQLRSVHPSEMTGPSRLCWGIWRRGALSVNVNAALRCRPPFRNASTGSWSSASKGRRKESATPLWRSSIIVASLTGGSIASIFWVSREGEQPEVVQGSAQARKHDSVQSQDDSFDTLTFRLSEVKKHGPTSDKPWVIYGTSVYDITDWIALHPGGTIVLRAAGGSVEPYWKIFGVHQTQVVHDILEKYKIGELDSADLVDGKVPVGATEDPFVKDPPRDKRLVVLTDRPRNAETPGKELAEFVTPNEVFYVRNHFWVPLIQEHEYRLEITLPDRTTKTYSLADLKSNFKKHEITATLQCAGNRREHMSRATKKTNGLPWTTGGISNAVWEGVRLRDVLQDAGLQLEQASNTAKHVQFSALETYATSIPVAKALDPSGDVLLAYGMNGHDLPRDHGFPIRVVAPGIVAARSVKWCNNIIVSENESPSQWQRRDYKCFGPNVGDRPDWDTAPGIQELPITSAVTSVTPPAKSLFSRSEKDTKIEGYAFSGGGREVIRVDISLDGGKTWDQAELLDDESRQAGHKTWCWKRWRYKAEVLTDSKVSVVVKATDESYNTQPGSYDSIWNARGNLSNAWHRVEIER